MQIISRIKGLGITEMFAGEGSIYISKNAVEEFLYQAIYQCKGDITYSNRNKIEFTVEKKLGDQIINELLDMESPAIEELRLEFTHGTTLHELIYCTCIRKKG